MDRLTKEQADYAAEHHNLIYSFLRNKHYPADEFYDIAANGYLRAVQTYFERDDLRRAYAFSTIAFWHMRTEISNHFRAESRLKRNAVICPLDEETQSDFYTDSVWESVMSHCTAGTIRETLQRVITPLQKKLAMMRADGYSDREIANRCGMKASHVAREIEAAGSAVVTLAPELLELIAA